MERADHVFNPEIHSISATSGGDSLRNRNISSLIADLPPAYFAMVMATGIVSIASHLLGYELISILLFRLNILAYVVLWALFLRRIIFYREQFIADMSDHGRGVGYLTIVAGTCILGSQFVILDGNPDLGLLLLFLGLALWLLLIYVVFTALSIRSGKPAFGEAINGVWFLATVSAQSLAILGSLLIKSFSSYREALALLASGCFMIGGMLYFLVIMAIFLRLLFHELAPKDFTPPYWINMGAVAITTLAGTSLMEITQQIPFLSSLIAFYSGVHFLLLGDGHLVDTPFTCIQRMATPGSSCRIYIHARILEYGIPAGNVHDLHNSSVEGDGCRVLDGNPPVFHLRSIIGLGNHFLRTAPVVISIPFGQS